MQTNSLEMPTPSRPTSEVVIMFKEGTSEEKILDYIAKIKSMGKCHTFSVYDKSPLLIQSRPSTGGIVTKRFDLIPVRCRSFLLDVLRIHLAILSGISC
jgi:hypothetical protein